ncbi:lytic transglycosylase domain-containing protein [Escherichia albertii]|uniref:lytic transglycosylase domain-containing protein n=1 Tax=Escherichia albertii TaxID=208962 RepID=UPI0017918772|nr:lytic transglycosylase domain-containing protein [Escherichia albertii]EHX2143214.1 lytic transglycosylase domain-containing protein [Escherichia albertii]EKD4816634.1 lytic transglycosylase domain-containing protein [Escherichia albertii]MCI5277661.1 lytic transglycosylase domain-containing protein [Escherichia albertii]MCZ8659959.1 lytic transglycosylase domain-containing protein [Escherichia albertii]MCZ8704521.1 lytic transglycosylase domain-containing protein [Escherichia albertii]
MKFIKSLPVTIFFFSFFLAKNSLAYYKCFNEAGIYYHIEPNLLKAIAMVESNMDKNSVGKNIDAQKKVISRDYGLMQINQIHIPSLKKRGLIKDENELLSNPCLNIKIGTEILYSHFSRCGVNWQCLGSYNAGFTTGNKTKRLQYAKKIYKIYTDLNMKERPKALTK